MAAGSKAGGKLNVEGRKLGLVAEVGEVPRTLSQSRAKGVRAAGLSVSTGVVKRTGFGGAAKGSSAGALPGAGEGVIKGKAAGKTGAKSTKLPVSKVGKLEGEKTRRVSTAAVKSSRAMTGGKGTKRTRDDD